ncbi:MAG: nuclear transport factor 2 family protein [Novosphingobium sp.]|nr:nuclear transport factor 2 family protein [Novosphingobium sp.]
MTDRDEIIEKINLYALAVDAQRWDLFDRIFIEKCDADYGTTAHWTDLQQFKSDFGAFHAPFDATQHMMMNHQVAIIDRENAHSMTYGSWRLVRHAAEGEPLWDGTGWYDDRWVRTHGGWRIAYRICRVIWYTGNDKVKETIPGVVFEDERTTLRSEGEAGRLMFLNAVS